MADHFCLPSESFFTKTVPLLESAAYNLEVKSFCDFFFCVDMIINPVLE